MERSPPESSSSEEVVTTENVREERQDKAVVKDIPKVKEPRNVPEERQDAAVAKDIPKPKEPRATPTAWWCDCKENYIPTEDGKRNPSRFERSAPAFPSFKVPPRLRSRMMYNDSSFDTTVNSTIPFNDTSNEDSFICD